MSQWCNSVKEEIFIYFSPLLKKTKRYFSGAKTFVLIACSFKCLEVTKECSCSLSKWRETGYRSELQPRWLKGMLEGKWSTHLISSCLINKCKQITAQLPLNANWNVIWLNEAAVPVSTHSSGISATTITPATQTTQTHFPSSYLVCTLWLMRKIRQITAAVHSGFESTHQPVWRGLAVARKYIVSARSRS